MSLLGQRGHSNRTSSGVAFNYGSNEYVIAVRAIEAALSSADAVVELVGITAMSGRRLAPDCPRQPPRV
jgi:hypothetical protein